MHFFSSITSIEYHFEEQSKDNINNQFHFNEDHKISFLFFSFFSLYLNENLSEILLKIQINSLISLLMKPNFHWEMILKIMMMMLIILVSESEDDDHNENNSLLISVVSFQ